MRWIDKILLITLLTLGFSSLFANPFLSNERCYEDWSSQLHAPNVDQLISNEEGVFLLVDDFWLCTEAFQTAGADSFVMVGGEWMSLSNASKVVNFA